MPQMLGFRIKNYKCLADVAIGQTTSRQGDELALPPLCCFIGPNGSGKSTLLDALGFVADCLTEGVEAACEKPHRGGLRRLRTQGCSEPIRFEFYYRQTPKARPVRYEFAIGEHDGVPIVESETLSQARLGVERGKLFDFLRLKNGRGKIWAGGPVEGTESTGRRSGVRLADPGRLGVVTFGNLKEHPPIVDLLNYISGWYLSYFVPDAARELPPAGAQHHLDRRGTNVGNVLQYLERAHPQKTSAVLERIARSIPGITGIKTEISPDNRLLIRFEERGFVDPFYQQSMSDGTLKMFAYLLLLNDPSPRPFIGIEEPENGLYHKLIERLAKTFHRHATRRSGRTQVLATTHSPYFVDGLAPEQVWLLQKDEHGLARATRAADMPQIRALVDEGLPLGGLWYSNHFEETFFA